MMRVNDSNRKTAVLGLQKCLLYLARYDKTIPRIDPDGIYGVDTKDAVECFQRSRGLDITGEMDFTTWQILFDEYKKLKQT